MHSVPIACTSRNTDERVVTCRLLPGGGVPWRRGYVSAQRWRRGLFHNVAPSTQSLRGDFRAPFCRSAISRRSSGLLPEATTDSGWTEGRFRFRWKFRRFQRWIIIFVFNEKTRRLGIDEQMLKQLSKQNVQTRCLCDGGQKSNW